MEIIFQTLFLFVTIFIAKTITLRLESRFNEKQKTFYKKYFIIGWIGEENYKGIKIFSVILSILLIYNYTVFRTTEWLTILLVTSINIILVFSKKLKLTFVSGTMLLLFIMWVSNDGKLSGSFPYFINFLNNWDRPISAGWIAFVLPFLIQAFVLYSNVMYFEEQSKQFREKLETGEISNYGYSNLEAEKIKESLEKQKLQAERKNQQIIKL